jgi:hypothetical protein
MICIALTLLALFSLAGCGGGGGGPTGPANPPQLTDYRIENQQPVSSGATIVLRIDYVDPSATMNDGIAYITYSEGTYQSAVSNAPGSSGTCLVSFELSPLVDPGQLLIEVWIQNREGTSSNTIQVLLNVA